MQLPLPISATSYRNRWFCCLYAVGLACRRYGGGVAAHKFALATNSTRTALPERPR